MVVLIHGVVLSLLMQSRSIAMPVREELLTMNVLAPMITAPPAPAQSRMTPSLQTTPDLSQTMVADATITLQATPQAATPQSAPAPVPALTQPRFDADYLDNPAPPYPPMARRLGEQGRVILRVHVLPNGQASEIHIQTSSNSSRLDQSARDTVSRWRFLPAQRGEEAIAAWVLVPIAFSLNV
ncbi:Protein TonB [Denitratisoma oestradiolicum]|uniref:Protein TonB n=1 Tax=Denitratisoma oestradiolicum TaxID=311182 RepID=A0A6S6XYP2_9PROT|nr:Protein TonB [Denitratisoma oestradiolicum]